MELLPPYPNEDFVRAACEKFDREIKIVEAAVAELFSLFALNDNHSRVLLKVVVLNRLYSTGILDVHSVAANIYRNHHKIDRGLAEGSPAVVKTIAEVRVGHKEKETNFYSFATKYCNWHHSDQYPIYDSRVDENLWKLQKRDHFSGTLQSRRHLYEYPSFRRIVIEFRESYGLEGFTFKQVDKFLWTAGGLASARPSGRSLEDYLNLVPDVAPDPGDELSEG